MRNRLVPSLLEAKQPCFFPPPSLAPSSCLSVCLSGRRWLHSHFPQPLGAAATSASSLVLHLGGAGGAQDVSVCGLWQGRLPRGKGISHHASRLTGFVARGRGGRGVLWGALEPRGNRRLCGVLPVKLFPESYSTPVLSPCTFTNYSQSQQAAGGKDGVQLAYPVEQSPWKLTTHTEGCVCH